MPRHSQFTIGLSDAERVELEARARKYTSPYRIVPFDRLVADVVALEPYRSARRVFWVLDNGSSHAGASGTARLQGRWPHLVVVHAPVTPVG